VLFAVVAVAAVKMGFFRASVEPTPRGGGPIIRSRKKD
jgi:hypothetical protein